MTDIFVNHDSVSLPRSRFLDITQRCLKRSCYVFSHSTVSNPPTFKAREKRPGDEVAVTRFPSDEPLHGTRSQNVIPGVPYLSGPVAFLVTHRLEIPGRVSPYGTLTAHPPSSQSEKSPLMSEYEQNADDEFDRRP